MAHIQTAEGKLCDALQKANVLAISIVSIIFNLKSRYCMPYPQTHVLIEQRSAFSKSERQTLLHLPDVVASN